MFSACAKTFRQNKALFYQLFLEKCNKVAEKEEKKLGTRVRDVRAAFRSVGLRSRISHSLPQDKKCPVCEGTSYGGGIPEYIQGGSKEGLFDCQGCQKNLTERR